MSVVAIPVEPLLLALLLIAIPVAAIAWDSRGLGDYGIPLRGFLIATLSFGAGSMYALVLLARLLR